MINFGMTLIFAFVSGALPFSVWIGRLFLHKDIRQYGDGNPGATNVKRAGGGMVLTGTAVLLDVFKGVIPVALANFVWGFTGWQLAFIASAPIVGHAYSPFLHFKGGKALAVTFGVWIGLTLWLVPIFLGIFFAIWLFVLKQDGWAVLLGMICLIPILIWAGGGQPLFLVWVGNFVVLLLKHRTDIRNNQTGKLKLTRQ
jgi:glycerol-3-phosphate acyltransferase PlsY